MGRRILQATLLAFAGTRAMPPIPGVQNHWVANTGGTEFNHVQNLIEDMSVDPDGTVRTWSFYDEGGYQNSTYRDGARWGINFGWEKDTAADRRPSRHASRGGVDWAIANFYGRAFMFHLGPPPTGVSAPIVVSSRGDTIRSVVDPTAIAFDNRGRLMVGDNGPDQNVKIFDVAGAPRLVETFGEAGGVFAGPRRGVVGPKRFWGIRGVGMDATGRLYVGCTGMPMQVGGGTHIRAFSGLGDTSRLLWEVQGLAFVNTVDADPDSDGVSLHKNSTRFHMDWSQPPGKSWSFAAATVDPFRYPDDPRLCHSLESVWFRRIHGKRFLFLGDMYGSYLAVVRFEDNSEVGIPTAFLPVWNSYRDSAAGPWVPDRRPIWGSEVPADRRWMWRDDNGDGQVQKDEFHAFSFKDMGQIVPYPYTKGLDIDDSGDIWFGGGPYMVQFRAGALDANGVPAYDLKSLRIWDVPYSDLNHYVMQCRYFPKTDRMYLGGGIREDQITSVSRYDHFTDTSARKLAWRADIPYKFPSDWSHGLTVQAVDTCQFPKTLTADADFVYIGYVDKGPDAQRSGEVSVYDANDGRRIGWIAPGPETHFMSGWYDLWHPLNAFVRSNGEHILMAEDDYSAKINVFRWCPGTCVPHDSAAPPQPVPKDSVRSFPAVRVSRGIVDIAASEGTGWSLALWSQDGRVLLRTSGKGAARIPAPGMPGMVYAGVQSGGTRKYLAFLGK